MNSDITNLYNNVKMINDDINNNIIDFITKASKLVELSLDMYQIEQTIKLNKISLKDYILNSKCAINLKNNNITGYSIKELKQYFIEYESNSNDDCSSYYLAIELYELLELIEKQVDNKVDFEINELTKFVPMISTIKNNNNYNDLYNQIISFLSGSNKENYDIIIYIINDIFSYYKNGYPSIPLD